MKKKIGIGLLVVIVGMQFFRIDKTNPPVIGGEDIIAMTDPSEEVQTILKNSCYDCHSNEVKYPWYTNIAPVSWFVGDHIEEGREHLNFSTWAQYSEKKRAHKLKECVEEVEEHEMPLESYTWMHSEAKLTEEQREMLEDWFKSI